MLWNAKNGEVPVGNTQMNYASFGQGDKILVVLPGLSDGLATVRGKALLLVSPYRPYLDRYTIYMFSRKDDMPDGYSIREMAADQTVGIQGSYDLADRTKDSKLHVYPDLGHAAYEKADDFYRVAFDFLEE